MGRGILKAKKKLKFQYLGNCLKEIERLQAENQMLKSDPASVVGKFINEFNDVVNQNQRLSALACAMIDKFGKGDSEESQTRPAVEITRDEIEVFRGKRLQIRLATPEAEGEVKFEEAKSYIFTYDAIDQAAVDAAKIAEAAVPTPCTDPNCTLPKDLAHTHTTPVPVTEQLEAQAVAPSKIPAHIKARSGEWRRKRLLRYVELPKPATQHKYTKEVWEAAVAQLNSQYAPDLTFALIGSIKEQGFSDSDVDCLVTPGIPVPNLETALALVDGFYLGMLQCGNKPEVYFDDRRHPDRPNGSFIVRSFVKSTNGETHVWDSWFPRLPFKDIQGQWVGGDESNIEETIDVDIITTPGKTSFKFKTPVSLKNGEMIEIPIGSAVRGAPAVKKTRPTDDAGDVGTGASGKNEAAASNTN